jgi:hypothetical protein
VTIRFQAMLAILFANATAQSHRWRNQIERLFNKLKNVATLYDTTKEPYLNFGALASIKIWMLCVHETNRQSKLMIFLRCRMRHSK